MLNKPHLLLSLDLIYWTSNTAPSLLGDIVEKWFILGKKFACSFLSFSSDMSYVEQFYLTEQTMKYFIFMKRQRKQFSLVRVCYQ